MLHLLQSSESMVSKELHHTLSCMVESGCQPKWQEDSWQETCWRSSFSVYPEAESSNTSAVSYTGTKLGVVAGCLPLCRPLQQLY